MPKIRSRRYNASYNPSKEYYCYLPGMYYYRFEQGTQRNHSDLNDF